VRTLSIQSSTLNLNILNSYKSLYYVQAFKVGFFKIQILIFRAWVSWLSQLECLNTFFGEEMKLNTLLFKLKILNLISNT